MRNMFRSLRKMCRAKKDFINTAVYGRIVYKNGDIFVKGDGDMVRIAICDDEAAEAALVKTYITEYTAKKEHPSDISIDTYTSSVELSENICFGKEYDFYILDILMPDLNGIQLADQIRGKQNRAVIIFLSSSDDFFPQAFDVYAFQYQIKPLNKEKFYEILDRAFSLFAKETRHFLFSAKEGNVRIPYSQITYVELADRMVTIYLSDGRSEQSAYLRGSFEELMEPLLKNKHFLQPHKSFIVNLSYVRRLDAQSFELMNGKSIPVSRKRSSDIKRAYTDYLLSESELPVSFEPGDC